MPPPQLPLLSVGMPVYNGQNYLAFTIEAILSQSFTDFELIISDNGSTDETEAICRAYAAQDARIRYERVEENLGAAYNFNRVFELARGRYFKWAAHDDYFTADYFERCIQVLEQNPAVVLCYAQSVVVDAAGEFVVYYDDNSHFIAPDPYRRFRDYLRHYRYPRQCHPVFGVIRSQLLADTALIGNYVGSDRILLAELVLRGAFFEIDEPLFFSRFHPLNSVRAYPEYRDRVAWFDPKKLGKLQMVRWIQLQKYILSIWQAPISRRHKAQSYPLLLLWTVWNFWGLAKDLLKGLFWPVIRILNRRWTTYSN